MTPTWNDIKHIFVYDGDFNDIWVPDTSWDDWVKAIDFLNQSYSISFGETMDKMTSQIDKKYISNVFADPNLGLPFCHIQIDYIYITMYFHEVDNISFDLNPQHINGLKDFYTIKNFMLDIAKLLQKKVIMILGSNELFPLMWIDKNQKMSFRELP